MSQLRTRAVATHHATGRESNKTKSGEPQQKCRSAKRTVSCPTSRQSIRRSVSIVCNNPRAVSHCAAASMRRLENDTARTPRPLPPHTPVPTRGRQQRAMVNRMGRTSPTKPLAACLLPCDQPREGSQRSACSPGGLPRALHLPLPHRRRWFQAKDHGINMPRRRPTIIEL